MIIHVGSTNKVKVNAVKECAQAYSFLEDAKIVGKKVSSGVSDQPKTLDETINGAMNRAKAAFDGAVYGIGIEGGITKVPHTKTGYMNIGVCAIFDGEQIHIGLSSGFEHPVDVMHHVIEYQLEVSDAYTAAGLTHKERIGNEEGSIGALTSGRVDRKKYCMQAVTNALIHLEHAHLFHKK